jgi:polyhydroxyalkanoate synthesis regulator phasin
VATAKRRRNSITRLIEDVVDDAKDLVDDVVDRARDVERDGRKAVRRAVSDDDRDGGRNGGGGHDDREMDDLKSAIDDLTAKVERLVALQAEARKPNQ